GSCPRSGALRLHRGGAARDQARQSGEAAAALEPLSSSPLFHLRDREIVMRFPLLVLALVLAFCRLAQAADLSCDDTTWSVSSLVGVPNNAVCVSFFKDPKVPGAACYISQARKGGVASMFGLAEDPSEFSIACRQIGPIDAEAAMKLPPSESVY